MSSEDRMKDIKEIPFDGSNFLLWKTQIQAWCEGMGYLQYLEEPAAESSPLTPEQHLKANKTKASLVCSLKPNVLGSLVEDSQNGKPAHQLWSKLIEFYERKNTQFKHSLREQLYGQHLKEDEDMSSYTQRIQQVALRLTNIGDDPSDSDLVYAILRGLPLTYSAIVAHARMTKDLSSQELIPILIDHQSSVRNQIEHSKMGAIHYVEAKPGKRGVKRGQQQQGGKRQTCSVCRKVGHNNDNCWVLHPELMPQKIKDKIAQRKQINKNNDQVHGTNLLTTAEQLNEEPLQNENDNSKIEPNMFSM